MAIEKIRVNGVDYDLGVSSGSGSGSGSAMPDLEYNNPELPNLYYGMSLKGKTKITIDMAKLADWLDANHTAVANNNGSYPYAGTLDNVMPSGSNYTSRECYILAFRDLSLFNKNIFVKLYSWNTPHLEAYYGTRYDSKQKTYKIWDENPYGDGTSTYRDSLTAAGTITIELSNLLEELAYDDTYNSLASFNSLDNVVLSSVLEDANLNTHPIDFITIE